MKNVLVLFGGISSEHEVSLNSASTILEKMDKSIFNPIGVGITKNGRWKIINSDIESLRDRTWENHPRNLDASFLIEEGQGYVSTPEEKVKIDVFFPMLHGPFGEDGTIQGLFEFLNIPIVGPKTLCAALSMDKHKSHKLISQAGILTPKDLLLSSKDDYDRNFERIISLGFPLFVKPLKGGSSFGISKVDKVEDLEKAIDLAFTYDDKVLIEEMIDGFEIFCAVMGNEELFVGELEEIELLEGFLDSNKKENLNKVKLHIPARISAEKTEEIKEIAKKIYRELDCQTYTRVDVFLNSQGKIYFNEVNTTPGFTETSAFPKMMKAKGIEIKDLITKLIGLAR